MTLVPLDEAIKLKAERTTAVAVRWMTVRFWPKADIPKMAMVGTYPLPVPP